MTKIEQVARAIRGVLWRGDDTQSWEHISDDARSAWIAAARAALDAMRDPTDDMQFKGFEAWRTSKAEMDAWLSQFKRGELPAYIDPQFKVMWQAMIDEAKGSP